MTKKNYDEIVLKKAGCTECFAAVEVEYQEMKASSEEVSKTFSKLHKRIETFAKDNNIKLVDSKDEFDIIIEKVNRINDYLQIIDLCISQAHYASEDVIKKFNEKNHKGAIDAVKTMKKEMKESMKRFSSIKQIKEDVYCLKKAEVLLTYYQQIADEIYPDMLNA